MDAPLPECQIVWNDTGLSDWEEVFARAPRANLLQSPGYARAICPPLGQRPRHGRILIDGSLAGVFQIQEAQILRRAIHAVILDRGPVWLDGYGTPDQVGAFFRAFDRTFPRRIGRKRRLLPEAPNTPEMRAALDATRLKRRPGSTGYQTVWVDLRPDLETLRATLKSRWRGALRKAEAAELTTEWSWKGKSLLQVLTGYEQDKAERGYPGPTVGTVTDLCRTLLGHRKVLVGTASQGDRLVAAALFLCHGSGSTYQVGWTTAAGRTLSASHLLLWQAMGELKDAGHLDLDLGGVNDADAKGVKSFKEGLGGETVELVGQYE
ncbi:GNAT family N-acetyltransferase [Thalassobaculum sp. OXR-137]|uniref:lipid II:glycine glycyltransferase FemX n=1 Tax=Thalassobaculum sp. OXR-137 TaxID=3100173 RepID=UPI002AC8E570|nr:GNAT family N-acetyltransferase [Thalassobaculum sp. OXR-137]WPZ33046.1 GNAT family N-acetyltransferase [Thalassobaculum sp. OXR-137]